MNILIFDESSNEKTLVMVSGESQSASRNITLSTDTSARTTTASVFEISMTSMNVIFGTISQEITISISKKVRSS